MARLKKLRFLEKDHPEVSAHEVPLEGVFNLVPPSYETLDGEPELADGEPPTLIGKTVIESWVEGTGEAASACPDGLVRAVEAVAIHNQENVTAIRRARWRRNSSGLALVAQIDCWVPMIRPATVNPRMAARAQTYILSKHGRPLVHDIHDGLQVSLIDAEHADQIFEAQCDVRDPFDYTGEKVKAFADSLNLEGIREELRGFVFMHTTDNGESGYIVETDDGWTRVAVAHAFMSQIMGVTANLSTLHWENDDGTKTVRNWTPETIRRAYKELLFERADFQVWPQEVTTKGVSRWVANASRKAKSNMRLMTARMDIGLSVKPYSGCRDHDVVYADMSRFHVEGQNPATWSPADDQAFRAHMVFSDLAHRKHITQDEKRVFFGEVLVPWRDDPDRTPFRNRVVATTAAMVAGVVDEPGSARYSAVLSVLERARHAKSPLQAAIVGSSMAAVTAGLRGSGDIGQFTATLTQAFRKKELRSANKHTRGNWASVYDADLDTIVAKAHEEFEAVKGSTNSLELGPHQLALAALALVAHASNPALRDYATEIDGNTRAWPSSMTRTGRGGRRSLDGREVPKVESDVVMRHAAASATGIEELAAIVRASTDHDAPIIPVDPEGTEEMLEEWLRLRWAAKPDKDGTPREQQSEEPDIGDGDPDEDVEDEPFDLGEFPDKSSWENAVKDMLDKLVLLAGLSKHLEEVPAPADLLGIDHEDWDPEDATLDRIIDRWGIEPSDESDADEQIETLRNFLRRGLRGYHRRGK